MVTDHVFYLILSITLAMPNEWRKDVKNNAAEELVLCRKLVYILIFLVKYSFAPKTVSVTV